jgi:hypothetical protein
VFYPWRDMGPGYVLPDDTKRQEVLRFLRRHVLVSAPLVLGCYVGIGSVFHAGVIVALLLALLWFVIGSRALVRGLEVAQPAPGLHGYCVNQARLMSLAAIVFCFVVYSVFAWGSAWLLSRGNLLFGIVGIVFFGAAANLIGYTFLIKIRPARFS